MKPETRQEYLRLASHFYLTRMPGQTQSPKRITDALLACAGEYRPAYWRRLRRALELDQAEKGYASSAERIAGTENPVTKRAVQTRDFSQVKPKRRRVKRVSDADEQALLEHLVNVQGDAEAAVAIAVVKYTGCRPSEIERMRVDTATGEVWIEGAKKSHGGIRGADRRLQLTPENASMVAGALKLIRRVGPIQDRIRAAGKRLWPLRPALPTLYSWRHQMGSDLKASGMERVEIAYIMGHQATASVDQYGDPRSGKGGVLPTAAEGADMSGIRETHQEWTPTELAPAPSPRGSRMR